jgi:hypothetical protein
MEPTPSTFFFDFFDMPEDIVVLILDLVDLRVQTLYAETLSATFFVFLLQSHNFLVPSCSFFGGMNFKSLWSNNTRR